MAIDTSTEDRFDHTLQDGTVLTLRPLTIDEEATVADLESEGKRAQAAVYVLRRCWVSGGAHSSDRAGMASDAAIRAVPFPERVEVKGAGSASC